MTGGSGTPVPDVARLRPCVHPIYVRLLSAYLERQGCDVDRDLFGGTGLTRDVIMEDDRFLSFEQFSRVVLNGEALEGRALGLKVGRSTTVSAHGPLGFALVACSDVDQVLSLMDRFSSFRFHFLDVNIQRSDDRVRLVAKENLDWSDVSTYTCAHVIAGTVLLFEVITGTQLTDTRVELPHPRPSWTNDYAQFLPGVEVYFDAENLVLDLPATFTRTRCLNADAEALAQAITMCERKAAHGTKAPTARRVLSLLVERRMNLPNLRQTAEALAVSERTLVRQLKGEGTTFGRLLDEFRGETILWYLQHTPLSVAEIAVALGYQDASNFGRATKRIFGVPPSELRKQGGSATRPTPR